MTLEDMRHCFDMCIYGYVAMPEHVHLLVNEPKNATLAEVMHFLKLSFAKRLRNRKRATETSSFWQKRYYDRNVRDAEEFTVKLRYLHRNPVERGLVKEPGEWKWSSYRHYALREIDRRNRVRMDSNGSGNKRRLCASVPQPRLASKERTRPGAPGTLSPTR